MKTVYVVILNGEVAYVVGSLERLMLWVEAKGYELESVDEDKWRISSPTNPFVGEIVARPLT